jgi:hypothetical protein
MPIALADSTADRQAARIGSAKAEGWIAGGIARDRLADQDGNFSPLIRLSRLPKTAAV